MNRAPEHDSSARGSVFTLSYSSRMVDGTPALRASSRKSSSFCLASGDKMTGVLLALTIGFSTSADGGFSWTNGALPGITTFVGGPFGRPVIHRSPSTPLMECG